jgi:hypothetical protein
LLAAEQTPHSNSSNSNWKAKNAPQRSTSSTATVQKKTKS